jgi:hypothetical protein
MHLITICRSVRLEDNATRLCLSRILVAWDSYNSSELLLLLLLLLSLLLLLLSLLLLLLFYSPLLGLGHFFSFLILYTVGKTPWTGISPTQGLYLQVLDIINVSFYMIQKGETFLAYFPYFETKKKRKAYEITTPYLTTLFACLFVAVGTCLLSCCLAAATFSGSTIPVLRFPLTMHSKVVGSGVFYAVRVVK